MMYKSETFTNLKYKSKGDTVYNYKIENQTDVLEIVKDLKSSDREKLMSIVLNEKNEVIGTELVAIGTLDASIVSNREIYKLPVLLKGKKIILVHNHPSGQSKPSYLDMEATMKAHLAGKTLGIELLYHIVLGDEEYSVITLKDKIKTYKMPKTKTQIKTEYMEVYQEKKESKGKVISCAEEAVEYIQEVLYSGKTQEIGIFLDTMNQINAIQISESQNFESLIKKAIQTNSKNVILVTNREVKVNQAVQMKNFLRNLDLALLDVINVTSKNFLKNSSYVSFANVGYLNEKCNIYGKNRQGSRSINRGANLSL
jgi:DNA repair protein RadC